MPERAKTMTVRWPGQDVDGVRLRLLAELDRLAQSRWGFLGYRRLNWEIRRDPDSADRIKALAASVRADGQFGNAGFVFPEDAEVWEGWATYEEMNAWKYVEDGADHWAP